MGMRNTFNRGMKTPAHAYTSASRQDRKEIGLNFGGGLPGVFAFPIHERGASTRQNFGNFVFWMHGKTAKKGAIILPIHQAPHSDIWLPGTDSNRGPSG